MKAPIQSSTIGINGLIFRVLCNNSVGGLIAALVLTRFSAHLLYAISPADSVTFTFITVIAIRGRAGSRLLSSPARNQDRSDDCTP
jgi:hypothetical protein